MSLRDRMRAYLCIDTLFASAYEMYDRYVAAREMFLIWEIPGQCGTFANATTGPIAAEDPGWYPNYRGHPLNTTKSCAQTCPHAPSDGLEID